MSLLKIILISTILMSFGLLHTRVLYRTVKPRTLKLCASQRVASVSTTTKMDDILRLCKQRGLIFQSSEIYNPLAGFFDYGHLGNELKNNIKRAWWKEMVQKREDMVGLDCSIISSSKVWEASGHLSGFSDPMVDCKQTGLRYRADHVYWGTLETIDGETVCYISLVETENTQEDATKLAHKKAKKLGKNGPFKPLQLKTLMEASKEIYENIPSPATGETGHLTFPRDFNLMFQTNVGAVTDDSSIAYLRPETAQGIFTNFVNIQRSSRMKIPFGIAQIGKAFRNELTPRNYIFRIREFEQMEIEYFISNDENIWKDHYNEWISLCWNWLIKIGLQESLMHKTIHEGDKLAHYAKACTDITFDYPFGNQELMGIAARGDYDLRQHSLHSKKPLEYLDPTNNNTKFIPHVIEPSIGVERLLLALLISSYREEIVEGTNEKRIMLALSPQLAPIKVSVLPLLSNKPELLNKSKEIYNQLKQRYMCEYDISGAIGRRYRRADEIGTPYCITIDFQTLEDNTVTIRYRDSMKQERMNMKDVTTLLLREIDEISI